MSDVAPPLGEFPQLNPKQGRQIHGLLNHLRDAPYDRDDLWQFLGFAMAMARRSKAQLFQDLWAYWTSGQKRGGYFVEFGAGDGEHLSNTHFLEKEVGWGGVLAEPNPRFHASLRGKRGCTISTRCVFSHSGETLDFLAARVGEYSRIAAIEPGDSHEEKKRSHAQHIEVQTISLDDLLTEVGAPTAIDYLSVDTEGSEFEILRELDFDRWAVAAISVEHNDTAARARIHDLLAAWGYRRQWPELSRFDDWYVRI